MAFLPTLPLYVEERFGIRDPAEVRMWSGAIYGSAPLCAAFTGPIWGALADRVGRKAMALRAMFGITCVALLMPLAESPLWLMLLRGLQGCVAGYVAPAISLVSASAPAGRQGRLVGNLQVGLALGLLTGPLVGAELVPWIGRGNIFYFSAVMAGLASLPVIFFTREDRSTLNRGPGPRSSLFADIRGLTTSRVVLGLLAAVFLMRFGQHAVEAYVALWVRELGPLDFVVAQTETLTHAVDRTIAVAFGVLAVAQILFTPLWGRLADSFGPLRCLSVLALGLGATLFVTGFVRDIRIFLMMRCVAAVFMAGTMTLAYASISKRVDQKNRSLAYAMAQSCIQFGLALGPLFGGFLTQSYGLESLFFLASACLLVAGLGMLILRVVSARS